MARGRMLAQSLSTSCKFAALHAEAGALAEFAQNLFMLAVAHADDCGRLQGDPWTVKHVVVPTSPRSFAEVDQALDALARVELVQRYRVDGRDVIAICRFQDHQAFRHPPRATLPPPPGTTDPQCPGTGADVPVPGLSKEVRKKGSKEGSKSRARARAVFFSSATYLEACPHEPPCVTPHLCGRRRQLAAAVAAGDIPRAAAESLEQRWLTDRRMAPATSRRTKKAATA